VTTKGEVQPQGTPGVKLHTCMYVNSCFKNWPQDPRVLRAPPQHRVRPEEQPPDDPRRHPSRPPHHPDARVDTRRSGSPSTTGVDLMELLFAPETIFLTKISETALCIVQVVAQQVPGILLINSPPSPPNSILECFQTILLS
jgi:hypothetical protein